MKSQVALVLIVVGSVSFQLAASLLALRLVRITERLTAWTLISVALFGMAVRRLIPLVDLLAGKPVEHEFAFEFVGLGISALMLAGVALIAPVFESIRRSKEALQESEERYRRLFNSCNDAILVYPVEGSIRGRIVEANEIACQKLGYSREELLECSFSQVLCHRELNDEESLGHLWSEKEVLCEMACLKKSGHEFPVEVHAQLFYLQGKPTILSIARDITERKRAEKEREKLIAELSEALAQVKTLKGLVPICSSCKKIRDDKGYWSRIEEYIEKHSEAEFTHGICPDCVKELYPDYHKD